MFSETHTVDKMTNMARVVVMVVLMCTPALTFDMCENSRDVKCGDLCAPETARCRCGGKSARLQHYRAKKLYCCGYKSCRKDRRGDVRCEGGTQQNLTQPCQGACNRGDTKRGYQLCDQNITTAGDGAHCVQSSKNDDKWYDCKDRSDEEPFAEKKSAQSSALLPSNTTECTDKDGNSGLR